jgi:hypothetical protein
VAQAEPCVGNGSDVARPGGCERAVLRLTCIIFQNKIRSNTSGVGHRLHGRGGNGSDADQTILFPYSFSYV